MASRLGNELQFCLLASYSVDRVKLCCLFFVLQEKLGDELKPNLCTDVTLAVESGVIDECNQAYSKKVFA